MREIMLFRAGDRQFGMDLSWVKRVYRAADLTEVQGKIDADTEGLRFCRLPDGAEMPLYDFPMIFGNMPHARTAFSPGRKIILLEADGTALSILADHIDHVVETDADHFFPLHPVFGEKSRKWFPAVFRTGTRLIPLLYPGGMAGIASAESGTEKFFPLILHDDAEKKQILR